MNGRARLRERAWLVWAITVALVLLTGLAVEAQPAHDVTAWHAPGLWHHHGADPATAHPALRAAMAEHWTQEIGSAWLSSEHENMFPDGMHAGFKNLIENDTGCPQLRGDEGAPCINAFVLQVHAAGTNAHGRVAVHSYKAALLVCDGPELSAGCGFIVTGGQHDYGHIHSPYKKFFCEMSDRPFMPGKYELSQTPYVALVTDEQRDAQIFWSSLGPNQVMVPNWQSYGYVPNRGLQVAWSELDAWDTAAAYTDECADSSFDAPSDRPENNGSAFQVFTIRFHELPSERPFFGYTDRWGNIQPAGACDSAGPDCAPLIISEDVPQGEPYFNRRVGPRYAPVLEFEDGTPLKPPPFEMEE